MRMAWNDRLAGCCLTARDVVNGWSQEELKRVLWQYGEERYAGPIAAAIVRERGNAPIETTGLIHAHIQRGVLEIGEAPAAVVQLGG